MRKHSPECGDRVTARAQTLSAHSRDGIRRRKWIFHNPRFAWRKSFRTSKSTSFHNSANCENAILIVCFHARFATATPNVRRFGLNNATRAFLPAKWSDRNVRPTLNTVCSSHIITYCKIDTYSLPFNSGAIITRGHLCQIISCGRTSATSSSICKNPLVNLS